MWDLLHISSKNGYSTNTWGFWKLCRQTFKASNACHKTILAVGCIFRGFCLDPSLFCWIVCAPIVFDNFEILWVHTPLYLTSCKALKVSKKESAILERIISQSWRVFHPHLPTCFFQGSSFSSLPNCCCADGLGAEKIEVAQRQGGDVCFHGDECKEPPQIVVLHGIFLWEYNGI